MAGRAALYDHIREGVRGQLPCLGRCPSPAISMGERSSSGPRLRRSPRGAGEDEPSRTGGITPWERCWPDGVAGRARRVEEDDYARVTAAVAAAETDGLFSHAIAVAELF